MRVVERHVKRLETPPPGVVALMDELDEVLVPGLGERGRQERGQVI